MQVPVFKCPWNMFQNMYYCFSGFAFRNCGYNWSCGLRIRDLWYNDLWNEQLGDRLKFVFIPYIILCGRLGSKHQPTNSLSLSPTPPSLGMDAFKMWSDFGRITKWVKKKSVPFRKGSNNWNHNCLLKIIKRFKIQFGLEYTFSNEVCTHTHTHTCMCTHSHTHSDILLN